jgi:hypothetical protein
LAEHTIHEAFRYRRGDALRIYNLHVVAGGVELWRVTETPDRPLETVKETDFRGPEAAARFLEEVERTLTAGGWRREPS